MSITQACELIDARHKTSRLRRRFRRILRDERGSAATVGVYATLVLLAAGALTVDSGLAYVAKSRMSKALDAAGLAAGRSVLTADVASEARAFFDANFNAEKLGASVTHFSATIDENKEVITLEAQATMPTTVFQALGSDSIDISARTVVHRQTRGMELALAMDNTGSMLSSDKIGAMKTAARNLINILYAGKESIPNFWVSLVPYTATVNIGPEHTDWLSADDQYFNDPSPFAPSTWKGCVEAREAPLDQDDTTPATAPFASFLYPQDVDNIWPPLKEKVTDYNNGTGPNLGCGPAITPLVAEKTTILSAIDKMGPWHRGGTTGNLGLVWAWRTVSPKWRGLWNGEPSGQLPLDYHAPLMEKVVVLLTDGDNQFYDWPSHTPASGVGPSGSDYTAYGRLHEFGFSTLDQARNEIDKRMTTICGKMKEEGIIVYTITFGSVPKTSTQTLYKNCATKPEYYFHAPNNQTLSDAFDKIGEHLSNLYIME